MYAIDEDECTGCGVCLEYCPSEAITMLDRVAQIDQSLCNECGTCSEVCPQNAIYEYEYEEVPAVYAGERAPATSTASRPPVTVVRRPPALTRQEKIAAAATLVPAISRFLVRLVGRISASGKSRGSPALGRGSDQQATGKASRGRQHRFRGGS
jgi:ferredoxin